MDFYPNKAFFRSSERAMILLEGGEKPLSYRVYHGEKLFYEGSTKAKQTSLLLPLLPEGGYGLEIGDENTAFEVSDHPFSHPRYGFLSDFGENDSEDDYLSFFDKMHLSLAQYYDWMYRHEDYLAPCDVFIDPMGKKKSQATVRGKIAFGKKHNILPFAYGAVYGATNGYAEKHPEERFYDGEGKPYTFIDRFSIMNFVSSPWRKRLLENYEKAIAFGFEGIHMDTYGDPKIAFSSSGKEISFADSFPLLINEAATMLASKGGSVTFNNVSAWPMEKTIPAQSAFDYVEVWPPFDTYQDLLCLLEKERDLAPKKSLVIAAYLAPFYHKDEKAMNAALFLDCVISAGGGFHLMYGENGKALRTGYYPDNCQLEDEDVRALRQVADFSVRYGDYLFDKEMDNVSLSSMLGSNQDFVFFGQDVFPRPQEHGIFALIKEKEGLKSVSLINFKEQSSLKWNEKKETPLPTGKLSLRLKMPSPNYRVYWASVEKPRMILLSASYESGFAEVTIPSFRLWGLLILKRGD